MRSVVALLRTRELNFRVKILIWILWILNFWVLYTLRVLNVKVWVEHQAKTGNEVKRFLSYFEEGWGAGGGGGEPVVQLQTKKAGYRAQTNYGSMWITLQHVDHAANY